MRFHGSALGVLFAVCHLCGSSAAEAQDPAETSQRSAPSFWHAAAGVATINWLTWAYNWYVQRWPWAKVGTLSWGRNIRNGFVWDNDCLLDNQLAHPYHGSLYYSSARASGYGFWTSFPFVAAGSAGWELFGENIPASLNDLINTTFGGIAIGEVTYRLSSLLGAKGERQRNSWGRGFGAFALSPVGRTQSLFHPGGNRQGDRSPGQPELLPLMAVGGRSGHAFIDLFVPYGSPFDLSATRPYDAFEFRLELGPGTNGIVRHVEISGLLARDYLSQSVRNRAVLGLFQHFDYEDLSSVRFGAQSLSGGVLFQHQLSERSNFSLGVHLEGVLLGEISSDHGFEWRRDYDLGPGAGGRVAASFTRDGREWLRFDSKLVWLHSVHGSEAEHVASFVRLRAGVPLRGPLGLGASLAVMTRRSTYVDFPPVSQRVPQIRGYLSWAPN
jgi:Domain of unknown function (DUF3943)